ncbi:uncharacterized protein LOC115033756 isoform X1 [Acyrthosiphon pisum]|uniref:Helicase associated domain-containing protein n=1 Tax=Acyrthosiphon pisum TaxID=7029 RepID=A0A8R2JPK2_ACYPI|nr:uncharacterized protein LOC115033756 isoform X1 [Acyrthosiphon pisum]
MKLKGFDAKNNIGTLNKEWLLIDLNALDEKENLTPLGFNLAKLDIVFDVLRLNNLKPNE